MVENTPIIQKRKKGLKRNQTVQKLNLSEHTLNINTRKCSLDKFRFADIEDYVRALSAGREYQFDAIKEVMIYLWGGVYKNIEDLARENWTKKPQIRDRFGSDEIFYGHFPLRDRISGVVHMATGTGKSFVIFAIAYLSVVMGLTKRVLVLGPSSTIIEQGLRDKFEKLMEDPKLNMLLPKEFQGCAINLLTDNDPIEDNSIVIENINATYTFGGIQDTLFRNTEDVLVLSDEVHHAYSHLKFNETGHVLELDSEATGGRDTEEKAERLWMKFLREHKEIKRHIGFTGTPYNADDYFADVIVDYSIKTATEEKYIKEINPLLKTEDSEGDAVQWTDDRRFEVVLKNHLDNKSKYSYVLENGKAQVKPITMFICPKQANAKKATEDFIKFLRKWEKNENGATGTDSEIEQMVSERVICVVSSISESEFKPQLDHIEEIDPAKVGGKVEFIFAVNKLSEGWDVDNVFQIVPMEERVFNSKLLISQVLGRGLRIPRKIDVHKLFGGQYYPRVTVTNHEKFAKHIEELMDAVIQSDMHIASEPLPTVNESEKEPDNSRAKHHFTVFNLNYLSDSHLVDAEDDGQSKIQSRTLKLSAQNLTDPVTFEYLKETKQYVFKKKTTTVDRVIDDLYRRFKNREWEGIQFDFGSGEMDRCPTENEIREVVVDAMAEVGLTGNQLADENRLQIELYFNQFLPRGKKKREFLNILGDIVPVSTQNLERRTVRLGELERGDSAVFLSEDYATELDPKSRLVVEHLSEARTKNEAEKKQATMFQEDPQDFLGKHKEYARSLVDGDPRSPFLINTSVLKSPQSAVMVSHTPEKEFVFMLLENAKYLDAWVKSPDKGFYSLDYDYWKGGKDRVRRSFNPDFFVVQNLTRYISTIRDKADASILEQLRTLEEDGIEELVRVIEIKSDEDEDDTITPKAEAGKAHFEALNEKLKNVHPADFTTEVRSHIKQKYFFDLLRPGQFGAWFARLREGK
ncbi:DEAD/DEAH box helicase family protein [Patescibacteria group bacterium]|nr:DEAD/DEAH box helicase family protein [Patescibacteria group bacterium]